ncbi:hypothetical protein FALBO_16548 [Fusarium albosuccineum]|uniref:Uncharacterized protein n=1 Tax=Fusarium albosuccineum TaxID=1237068 RepID=A0A8H4KHY7_9HYPO|nr:hypothetical protein FALBO_16548 [Fusarium albosuccineum]
MCWKTIQFNICRGCGHRWGKTLTQQPCEGAKFDMQRYGQCSMGVRMRDAEQAAECGSCRRAREQREEEERRRSEIRKAPPVPAPGGETTTEEEVPVAGVLFPHSVIKKTADRLGILPLPNTKTHVQPLQHHQPNPPPPRYYSSSLAQDTGTDSSIAAVISHLLRHEFSLSPSKTNSSSPVGSLLSQSIRPLPPSQLPILAPTKTSQANPTHFSLRR